MRMSIGFLLVITGLTVPIVSAEVVGTESASPETPLVAPGKDSPLPLLHQREGGTPYDARQALQPYAVRPPRLRDAPLSGLIESPPEYAPTRGVLFYYTSAGWPTVVRDLVVALTQDPAHDEIAYVVVPNASQQTHATDNFTAGGADMSKVEFIIEPANAIWLRDYGPHFIWQDGALGIVDSHYYITRSLDNFIPTLLGDDHFIMPTYDMGLYYSGGNFQPGPDRSAVVSSLVNLDNPPSAGFDAAVIAELYSQYQGIDTLHVFPQLPPSVDGTGHIDMWMYIVDEANVIISEFKPGSDPTAIQITNDAVPYMESLGFKVYRTPAWNAVHPSYGDTHYTYTNAFRVNDRIFVSTFGGGDPDYLDEDAEARTQWEAAAGPGVEIVAIDCYDIIWAAGAIHCIVMQVPRYTEPVPSVHVISPCGGELLVGGTTHTISWVATDTDNVAIPQVDLYYSADGGGSYTYITTTTDTGTYDWTVPELFTFEAKVKVVVTAADLDAAEAVSAGVFQISTARQTVYDFTTGAGVDKFGWGHETSGWLSVDGNRMPVTTGIDTLVGGAYEKLAYSDATGGDTDANRYRSPNPATNNESTHVLEFAIAQDPALIDDIGILWEGYADHCTQVELYIWDYVAAQWCDGRGLMGQNRFMDNWAGNRDGYLGGHIRADFERYLDDEGVLTLLVYSERGTVHFSGYYYIPSFHDYVAVTVSLVSGTGDFDGDGNVDGDDYVAFAGCFTGPNGGPVEIECLPGDFEGDGDVDCDDWDQFVLAWTEPGEPPALVECPVVSPRLPGAPHHMTKNRYISFDPDNPGLAVAFRVRLTASAYFPDSGGDLGWVGVPDENGIARLVDAPFYGDAWPAVVHLGDCPIVPAATYEVTATMDEAYFSAPLTIATIGQPAPKYWADCVGDFDGSVWTGPNGVVNMDDIMSAVQRFQQLEGAPHLTWVDVHDEVPNAVLNMTDIFYIILGFKGEPYPFSAPGECP